MKRCRLKVVREEMANYETEELKVKGSEQLWSMLKKMLGVGALADEYFWAIGLDTRHRMIDLWEVAHGSLNESVVHPREVYKRLITGNAHACIFVHNHPSGMVEPSKEDQKLTSRLVEAGELLGVKVIDHLVISDKHYYSFAERGKI